MDSIHRHRNCTAETKAGTYEDAVTEEVTQETVTRATARVVVVPGR